MPVGRPYPEAVTVAGLVWPPNEDLKIGLQSFLSFYTFLNNYLSACPIFSIFFLFLIRHQRHNIQEWMQSLKKQIQTTTQWSRWGSNTLPLGLESSTLPLSHCAPRKHSDSGRVLDSRTRAAGSSLTSFTVLCLWARHIYPCLVLVQPRKVYLDIAENCWLAGA